MKKLIRYSLKTLAWVLGVIVLLWIVLWIYVELNEAKLIAKISDAVRDKTRGDVMIGGASVSLIRTFPVLSLQLSDVVIRDSLHSEHKRDFLSASDIYLRISLRELLRGRSALGRITIYNSHINIITDSSGRSNEYIVSQQKQPEGQPKSSVPEIILYNSAFHYENRKRNKLYDGTVRTLMCEVGTNDKFVLINIRVDAQVNHFGLNIKKGSYLKNTDMEGAFRLSYNKKDHDLLINHVLLEIDRQPFHFDGYFRVDKKLSDFSLTIATTNIEFKKALSLLSDSLGARLAGYAFSKPVSPQVTINGQTTSGTTPDVRIKMHVDLATVVRAGGITSLQFIKGAGDVDLTIVSSEKAKDTTNGDLNGAISFKDADIKYLPREFSLKACNGAVKFSSNDIVIDTFSARAGHTTLLMRGHAGNVITLGPGDPGKSTVSWKLTTPELHIEDFKRFLSQGKVSSKQSSLDKLFSSGDVFVSLAAQKMDYGHFKATNVEGKLVLKESGIQLQRVFFNHAGGSMDISGEVRNGVNSNPVNLRTRMKNMDIPQLFTAFDNFGQDALTKTNLKGRLTADVIFKTAITNQAKLIGSESKGTVQFLLENGELNNFEPLIEVSKKAFKKQDFTEIKFADLKNKLEIAGTTFIVNPMEIRSTVATIFVEGVYDIKKGTDMSIQFPLRNLTKNQANTDLTDEGRSKKGISLRLRAKTGDDGKLKVTWDPFRRSIKNRDVIKDSLDSGTDKMRN